MRWRTRSLALVSSSVLVVAFVPSTLSTTQASWNDREWAYGGVGSSSFECGTDDGYTAESYGHFLAGELLGQSLDIPLFEALTLHRDGDVVTVDPADATDLGSPEPTNTYIKPLLLDVSGVIDGLNLDGFGVGLPEGSTGAVNQYAQVSGYGTAAGAAGLVSNSGAVLVTPTTPSDELPEPATISLGTLLPPTLDIADVGLLVGAVASSSVLDGCAALRSALWGDGSITGVTRDYGIASLELEFETPALGDMLTDVTDAVSDLTAAVDALIGSDGLISNTISAEIAADLPLGLASADLTGTVTISGLDLTVALGNLLTDELTDGVVTINLAAGTITVDLAALLGYPGGLNNLGPNTELVVNSVVVNGIVSRVGDLLDAWTTNVTSALTSEIRDATLTVDLTTRVSILAGISLLDLGVGLVAPLGEVLDGTAVFAVDIDLLGLVTVLDLALAPLGLSISGVTSILNGLATGLVAPVANTVTTTLLSIVTSLGSTLADVVAPVVDALDVVIDALPTVLSVMANVQPDQPGAPPGSSFVPAAGHSTPQYLVSALRIGLADFAVPDDVAHVSFATSSAGPVATP